MLLADKIDLRTNRIIRNSHYIRIRFQFPSEMCTRNSERVRLTIEDLNNIINKFDLMDIQSFTINSAPNKHRISYVSKLTWTIIRN